MKPANIKSSDLSKEELRKSMLEVIYNKISPELWVSKIDCGNCGIFITNTQKKLLLGDYYAWQEGNFEVLQKNNESDLTALGLWINKTESIEQQPIKCIEYIYNLVK